MLGDLNRAYFFVCDFLRQSPSGFLLFQGEAVTEPEGATEGTQQNFICGSEEDWCVAVFPALHSSFPVFRETILVTYRAWNFLVQLKVRTLSFFHMFTLNIPQALQMLKS